MQTSKTGRRPGAERGRAALLRAIPGVGRLLERRPFRSLAAEFGAALTTELLRESLGRIRKQALDGSLTAASVRSAVSAIRLALEVRDEARRLVAPAPRSVINATGVVVHTNLGRAVLSEAAASRVAESACAYVDLEYDLARGGRGSRLGHLEPLAARLFPGFAFAAVNNNAAAILLALRALARGKEVVVSRGELVEIGGSFRVPEILAASGARLREVGTTNRTRTADYEAAISGRTGAILKVHTSNFRIVGFTEEAGVSSLAAVAKRNGVPLVVDWGSGDLVDLSFLGIADEIPVLRILRDGADLVTFSGDKLLGGPQAGLIVGRGDLVARLRRDPMARVCRLDRLLIGALRETLASYVRGRAFVEIPTLRMLAMTRQEVKRRASRLMREVVRRTGARGRLSIEDGVSRAGGGSSPLGERPTSLLAVDGPSGDAGRLERALRAGDPPVLARLHEGKLLLDLRTVLETQERALADRLVEVVGARRPAQTLKRNRITSPSRTT